MVESVSSLLNTYPILWMMYGFAITLPLVACISYFFWPKESDSVGHRKKTDAPSPDDKGRDNISDSGIEASGEDRSHFSSEEREIFPDTSLQGNGKSHDLDVSRSKIAPTQTVVESRDVTVINVPVTDEIVLENGINENFVESESDSNHYHHQNGTSHPTVNGMGNGEVSRDDEDVVAPPTRWVFPPVLEDFDLMESDVDPSLLEDIFADERLLELKLRIEPDNPGLGISIVGGSGSPSGDLPILVKRILHDSLAERDGRLKSGDEIVAVNETLLVGTSKDYAINTLSKMEGSLRLLILRDE